MPTVIEWFYALSPGYKLLHYHNFCIGINTLLFFNPDSGTYKMMRNGILIMIIPLLRLMTFLTC